MPCAFHHAIAVYKAHHPKLRSVALKCLLPQHAQDVFQKHLFLHEAQLPVDLEHRYAGAATGHWHTGRQTGRLLIEMVWCLDASQESTLQA